MSGETGAMPAALAGAIAAEPVPIGRWDKAIAPHFISLFLWIVYFDQIASETLFSGGLFPALRGAIWAGLLAFGLFYLAPALLGLASRRPFLVVAARTFGTHGSARLVAPLLGVVQTIWFAVTIRFSAALTLKALAAAGLVQAGQLAPLRMFAQPFPSAAFLVTTLLWAIAAALIGTLALKLVAAVMSAYPIFPALALAAAMVLLLSRLKGAPVGPLDPPARGSGLMPAAAASLAMVQYVLGFFSTAGIESVDLGATGRNRGEVALAGLVGVTIASIVVAAIALVTIAAAGSIAEPLATAPRVKAQLDYSDVLALKIGGGLGCTLLIVFATACLGPACYTASTYSKLFSECFGVKRWVCALLGAIAAWLGLAWGTSWDLATTFTLVGSLTSPLLGALAADFVRHRGRWTEVRYGWSIAGALAWLVGAAIGLTGLASRLGFAGAWAQNPWLRPTILFAFLTAFGAKTLLNFAAGGSRSVERANQ